LIVDAIWRHAHKLVEQQAIAAKEPAAVPKFANSEHLATIGNVSQPRISQTFSLTMLAPDIQETLLFLPRLSEGKPDISEKSLRIITKLDDWEEQRRAWEIMRSCSAGFIA
jgi:hypothetical protein